MHGPLSFSELRQRTGMSVEELAQEIGYSASTVYRWERGEIEPKAPIYRTLEMIAKLTPTASNDASFRFIDLFAGIGGLRIGFQAIGGHCVFTSEWDPKAQETYSRNFRDNHPLAGDIRPFADKPTLVPEHDVLLGGFPCQPFSIAGVSKKNALGRPHGFLCDTQGTCSSTPRRSSHTTARRFRAGKCQEPRTARQGPHVRDDHQRAREGARLPRPDRVISSEPWVPQKRERIFIVGFREPTAFDLKALELPMEAVRSSAASCSRMTRSIRNTHSRRASGNISRRTRPSIDAKGNGFGYSLFGPNDVARTLSARYYKDGSEILIDQPGKRPRRLTPLECARLMGFDRGDRRWHIPVSDTQAYRQFGNAVVVPVVEFLAQAMKPHLETALSLAQRAGGGSRRALSRGPIGNSCLRTWLTSSRLRSAAG